MGKSEVDIFNLKTVKLLNEANMALEGLVNPVDTAKSLTGFVMESYGDLFPPEPTEEQILILLRGKDIINANALLAIKAMYELNGLHENTTSIREYLNHYDAMARFFELQCPPESYYINLADAIYHGGKTVTTPGYLLPRSILLGLAAKLAVYLLANPQKNLEKLGKIYDKRAILSKVVIEAAEGLRADVKILFETGISND